MNALDPQTRAVQADYNAKVAQWRDIYGASTFHDHTIQQRMARTLAVLDAGAGSPAAPGGDALDVGCGAGQLLVELGRRGYTVVGIDIAEGMVAEARALLAAEGLDGTADVADVAALPFADGRFAVVTALGVIEYVPDPDRVLRELGRVLAPGGRLIVTNPNPLRPAFLLDPVRVLRRRLGPEPAGYPRRYLTAGRFARLLRGAGLSVKELRGHGVGEWTIAGVPVLPQALSIRIGLLLERVLPEPVLRLIGANLIAVAGRR